MLKLVIFDMDGTLGDTLGLCIEAFRECVEEVSGRRPTAAEVEGYFGVSDRGVLGHLLGLDPESPELPVARLVEIYKRLHPRLAPAPFPGAGELLLRLRTEGLGTALITGKEAYTAEPTLEAFGMVGLFDHIGYGVPTHNCKDECMRRLLREFALLPEEVIYIGDAPSDIEHAHRVGIPVISAAWASTAAAVASACESLRPEYRLTNFDDLLPLLLRLHKGE